MGNRFTYNQSRYLNKIKYNRPIYLKVDGVYFQNIYCDIFP